MGKVYLIGAGPGAADLITVRGARLLGAADVVLHDALVEPAMLDYAPTRAKRIAVGKRCGQLSTAQQFINKQIVDAALEHGVVVRLKGGDPMLFGRADEEMRALEAAGIEYEVVPGITAALASAATLKRSLTLRGVSRSVALATFSRAPGSDEIREQVNADSLVFYMQFFCWASTSPAASARAAGLAALNAAASATAAATAAYDIDVIMVSASADARLVVHAL